MKKLQKIDFDSPEMGSYDEKKLWSLCAQGVNDLIESVTELQDQNRELWEYVTSTEKTTC